MIEIIGLLLLGTLLVIIFFIFWPGLGFFHRWRELRRLTDRVLREDALKHLLKSELKNQPATLNSLAGALQINPDRASAVIDGLVERELVYLEGEALKLSSPGREAALHIIRAHRIWEQYLAEETGFAEEEWHARADRAEHDLSPEEVEDLEARLGHPTHDPHGDPIPSTDGILESHGGKPLIEFQPPAALRIVHIGDEPETVNAQLVAEGLYPRMEIYLIGRDARRVRFWANGEQHLLAPILAANISAVPIPWTPFPDEETWLYLSDLQPGQRAEIVRLSPGCRGAERRRLLDLGFLPGTEVQAEFRSPGGDPTAYRVRGTLLALRAEQAGLIAIQPLPEKS